MASTDNSEVFPPLQHSTPEAPTRIKVWRVQVEGGEGGAAASIITEHGLQGGKLVRHVRVVVQGKNVGKANETSPLQQALSEAKARWREKLDDGYAPPAASNNSTTPNTNTNTTTSLLLPMLAHDFGKRGLRFPFPCFAQRKLDGVRCLAQRRADGTFVLASRTGKPFPHCEHITGALERVAHDDDLPPLDGELYSETLHFQELTGLVKKVTLTAEDVAKQRNHVFLWVYDVVLPGGAPYAARQSWLDRLFEGGQGAVLHPAVRLLSTEVCADREALKPLHDGYVAEGYEGAILRATGGLYAPGKRSADLQKYKEFEDAEYRVVDFTEGEGAEKGAVMWVCELAPGGRRVSVRPRGTHEERRALFARAREFLGKPLTVRYQELTPDGVPRFPVGIAFRDYE